MDLSSKGSDLTHFISYWHGQSMLLSLRKITCECDHILLGMGSNRAHMKRVVEGFGEVWEQLDRRIGSCSLEVYYCSILHDHMRLQSRSAGLWLWWREFNDRDMNICEWNSHWRWICQCGSEAWRKWSSSIKSANMDSELRWDTTSLPLLLWNGLLRLPRLLHNVTFFVFSKSKHS